MEAKVTVFISYSWEEELHNSKVSQFVTRLEENGVQVYYDRYMKLGERFTDFMELIDKSDYVLFICTPVYKEKSDKGLGGVKYEKNIITADLYEKRNERKFIPVLFSGTWNTSLPIWAKGKLGIDYTKEADKNFQKLLSSLKEDNLYENIETGIKTKKKVIIFILLFLLLIILVIGVYEYYKKVSMVARRNANIIENGDQLIMSESSYKNIIEETSQNEIVYSHYNDFDSDGICEMFAIVGDEIDDDIISGEIWFANQQGAYKIEKSKDYWKNPNVYLFDDDMFIAFNEYYTTGTITYLWGVQNDKPFQPSLTEKANGFTINNYNEVVVSDDTYDAVKTIYDNWKVLPDDEVWTGHTWNKYYYYWNGNSFREYGAIEITVDDLLQIEGSDELIEYINGSGSTINEIYYRANNVFQINYQKEEREKNATITYYSNIMFRYTGKRVTLEECEFEGGIILRALNTSLAVYPDDFDIDFINSKFDSNNDSNNMMHYILLLVCCLAIIGMLVKLRARALHSGIG